MPRQRGGVLRVAGSLFGLGCWAIGLFSVFGGSDTLPELNASARWVSASRRSWSVWSR